MQIFFRFPRPRVEQKKLMDAALEAIRGEKILLAHAPTGLGKTDATLSAALSYALEQGQRVFFLTPKISQHEIALDVVRGLNKKFDLGIKAIDFVGRRYMCIDPLLSKTDFEGFYELCARKRAREECIYFNNARGSTYRQIELANFYKERIFSKLSQEVSHLELRSICLNAKNKRGKPRKLCPYEVAIDIANDSKLIVCDYYHLFNPKVRKRFLSKINETISNCIVIVDEAHNLNERLLSLQSATLTNRILEKAIKELKQLAYTDLAEELKKLLAEMSSLAKNKLSGQKEAFIKKDEFLNDMATKDADLLKDAALDYMEASGKAKSSINKVARFIERWNAKEKFARIISRKERLIKIKLRALDAAQLSKRVFDNVHSAILMSGTMLPLEMHVSLLSLDEGRTIMREFSDPFPKKNRLNLIVPTRTTKYNERNQKEFSLIAKELEEIINRIPGNTIVFFPSFDLLESVSFYLEGKLNKPVLKQRRRMHSSELAALLDKFRDNYSRGYVLLGVASGSLAEGIDYAGDKLLAAIIVGIPLAEMDLERQALIDYYEEKFGRGWHYAYLYPAIIKALQCAGRVIRSANDRGIAVFLDKRYVWKNFRNCFPKDFNAIKTTEPAYLVERFFRPF
ncbi:MAG: ATP-dependent DNA helicase [Candidatus Diapherotrites archaeon]|nr:ATP-dependent DNA helicase [Candidatus Diapherotrites archaeon]